jgi:hypothetical protein
MKEPIIMKKKINFNTSKIEKKLYLKDSFQPKKPMRMEKKKNWMKNSRKFS